MTITYLEQNPKINENYNRYDGYNHRYIIHKDWQWHFGRFPTMEKLQEFLDFAGLKATLVESYKTRWYGEYKKWVVKEGVVEHGFVNLKNLPEGAKKFIGLSNGELVECYLLNDGENLHVYRPNPNCKDIYKPLSIEEHIAYKRENGYV